MSSKKKSAPPKLHKFMHPRNPYLTPASFKNLAQKYPRFRAHCIYELNGKVRLNFKDPNAVRELTTSLLDQDFGLKVDIPDGRLVPTLPLRFNYLLWLEDLLTFAVHRSLMMESVIGIDIGCGASCIYPLLGAKQNGWCMVSTEADEVNFISAIANVKNNNLEEKIMVKKVDDNVIFKSVLDDDKILGFIKTYQERKNNISTAQSKVGNAGDVTSDLQGTCDSYVFDFTMCNPPFFSSVEETDSMSKSRKERKEPTSASTGAVQETVTEGGEVAFIFQMIDESVHLKEKVRIFTTMIGSKSHVNEIKSKLKTINPAHTAVVEFCQGRTMRWGIAWTFDPGLHIENVMSKKQMVDAKPLILRMPRSSMSRYTVQAAWAMVNKWLHELKVTIQVFKNTKYFVGANIKAYKPTWLHQRRKRRAHQVKEAAVSEDKSKETMTDDGETARPLKRTAEEAQLTENEDAKPEPARAKSQKTCTVDNSSTTASDMDDDQQVMPLEAKTKPGTQKLKEMLDSEELDSSLPRSLELRKDVCTDVKDVCTDVKDMCTDVKEDMCTDVKEDQGDLKDEASESLKCILRAKLQLKQCGGLISLEALYLRGSYGKDGLNQVLQYMRNKLASSL